MPKRQSINEPVARHENPIPNASMKGNILMSSIISGRDPETHTMPPDAEAQIANIFKHIKAAVEAAGGTVLSGMCFYQSYAREMSEANGWKRLATNSAKLTNIIGGYGYSPSLGTTEQCVESAIVGRMR